MNPEGEHLGYRFIPLPTMYMLLLVTWVVATAVWCYNWIKYRVQSKKLQVVFSIYPITKCLFAASGIYFWHTVSRTGYASLATEIPLGLLYIAEEAVLYTILLLIASGWGLSRDRLGIEKFIIGVAIISLVITQLLGFALHTLFYLLSVIVYVIIVVIIFRFINKSICDLQIEIRNNPRPADNSDQSARNPMDVRDKILNFKIFMLAYVFALMLIGLFELLFFQNDAWIEMMKELLEVQGVICVGLILRLRPINVYYPLEDENDPPAYFRQPIEMANLQSAPGQGTVALN